MQLILTNVVRARFEHENNLFTLLLQSHRFHHDQDNKSEHLIDLSNKVETTTTRQKTESPRPPKKVL